MEDRDGKADLATNIWPRERGCAASSARVTSSVSNRAPFVEAISFALLPDNDTDSQFQFSLPKDFPAPTASADRGTRDRTYSHTKTICGGASCGFKLRSQNFFKISLADV